MNADMNSAISTLAPEVTEIAGVGSGTPMADPRPTPGPWNGPFEDEGASWGPSYDEMMHSLYPDGVPRPYTEADRIWDTIFSLPVPITPAPSPE